MSTDPYMGFEYPEIGGSRDAWGNLTSAALQTISAHRHVPGEGVKVPVAGLLIDDDILAFDGSGSYFALLQARALGLQPVAVATVASDTNVFYVSTVDDELYFKDDAGNHVKITNNGALDITLLGGIVGDYASSGAEAAYVEIDTAYTWKQPGVAPKAYAYMKCGPVDLHEPVAGVNQRVRLQSPAGLVSSYAVTWPGALPAGKRLVQVSAAGVTTYENTGVEATTFTGLVTANAGVTCAANQHVTVSGTGEVKHGDREINVTAWGFGPESLFTRQNDGTISFTANATVYRDIPLRTGDRIKSLSFTRAGEGTTDVTADVILCLPNGGAPSTIGTVTVNNIAGVAVTTIDVTDTQLAAGQAIGLIIALTGVTVGAQIGNIQVTLDRP